MAEHPPDELASPSEDEAPLSAESSQGAPREEPLPGAPQVAASSGWLGRFLLRGPTEQSVAAAAGIVAAGFLASRLLGLLRSVAIADAFGTEPELASYWVAFRIPDLVFQLLSGATLSAAFIPVFARVRMHESAEEGWRLASAVLNLVSMATLAVAALAFALAPWIVPLLAPGLGEGSGREAELESLAVELTRIMLLSPIFFGVSGMVTGILNGRQHFVAPALAPLFYNASIIGGALLLAEPMGVRGIAVGVVVGSVLHLLVQLPALATVGMRWRPAIDVASASVREVLRLAGPRVIGLAAAQLNLVIVLFFASFVSDQAISAVSYAFLVMMLPVAVVGMAISTATFPLLAQQAAARRMGALAASLTQALSTILFLAVPASAGLLLLAGPLVRALLQRGAFDAASSELVASVVAVYAVAVFAHAGIEILSRGFYALSDTRTPVQITVLATLLNVALCAALVAPFGVEGLAAAASIAAILEFALLARLLSQRLGGLGSAARRGAGTALPGSLAGSLWRTVAATAVMAEVVVMMRLLLGAAGVDAGAPGGAAVVLVLAGAAGLLAYFATALALRSEEARRLLGRFAG
jgi:putative peptidoglycan lipid II flippase